MNYSHFLVLKLASLYVGHQFLILQNPTHVTHTMQLSAMDANQFGIWGMNNELMGVTVHPAASFFNHSCLPNCFRKCTKNLIYSGNDIIHDCSPTGIYLVFRTLMPVPAREELSIAYIKISDSVKTRRKVLNAQYNFHCVCLRCARLSRTLLPHYYLHVGSLH